MQLLVLTLLAACAGGDSAKDSDTGSVDTSSGGGGGGGGGGGDDTDTDESTATYAGSVTGPDGAPLSGARLQLCSQLCFYGYTEADGSFLFEDLDGGDYKIDADGFDLGSSYGYGRFPAPITANVANTAPLPLFVPDAGSTKTVTSGTYTFGDVTWTVDSSILTLPLGYDEFSFTVGVTDGLVVPDYWSLAPVAIVTFLPFATSVDGSFDLVVSGAYADGNYTVYDVDVHGNAEEAGTAVASGGTLTATGLTPSNLSWILFVPAA